ncbi:M57 family metalloprotease [Lactobacillus corticis]|uniref:Peptidase M10 metallopeptidase domain-containing protein n=1 Tax=Lactobacillus corticis TaxID=2201249 RepID=A0A916VHY9_9LACO|nr:M57 family metalloprotease [Lactobacillus corticis]GFZ26788.1 hypothetical protein LCB40_06680 [Lactobacillus corticis]
MKAKNILTATLVSFVAAGACWLSTNQSNVKQGAYGVTTNLVTVDGTETVTGSAHKWGKDTARVYVSISSKSKSKKKLKQATYKAISRWNSTKSFHFSKTSKKSKADIVVTLTKSRNNAAGQTTTSYDLDSGELLDANVRLNTYYLLSKRYKYSYTRLVNTAEHELGHAIGLKHNRHVSVMYPSGSRYCIHKIDVKNTNKLYK